MDIPRQKLQEIVTQYGHSVYHDHKLCKALLKDFCGPGQYLKEISLLVVALEEGIPAQLLASKNTVPHVVLIAQFIKKLEVNRGLTEEAARWAVESWVLALGVSFSSAPQQQQQQEECRLESQRGINYTLLRDLLIANEWKEADLETRKLMLKAARREEQGWFNSDSIQKFPCEDLQIIDKLWLKHSDGKFGFSVQKSIYQNLRITESNDGITWNKFFNQVGWKKNNVWLNYDELSFNTNFKGHLPTVHSAGQAYFFNLSFRIILILSCVFICFVAITMFQAFIDSYQGLWSSLYSRELLKFKTVFGNFWQWQWQCSSNQYIYISCSLLILILFLVKLIVYFSVVGLLCFCAACVLLSPLDWFSYKHQKNVVNRFLNVFLQCNL